MTLSIPVPDLLVARAKAGDLEAIEGLYRAFETPVYNLARRMLRHAEDAEDVLQETFLEVVKSIKQYRGDGGGNLWAWIRQVAASKALMRLRREKLRTTEVLEEETAGRPPAAIGVGIDLEKAFEQISDVSRAVVWLHDVEGFTHEEIAERMGKTVSFSKSQLARAHARMRQLLAPGGGDA